MLGDHRICFDNLGSCPVRVIYEKSTLLEVSMLTNIIDIRNTATLPYMYFKYTSNDTGGLL